MTLITFNWRVNGNLTDADLVELKSTDDTYGVRRTDTLATVVAAETEMGRTAEGVYEYEVDDPAPGLVYEYWIHVLYDGYEYNIHRFKTASEGAIQERTIRFVCINQGEIEIFDDSADGFPMLKNPSNSFGAKRISDSTVVIPAGTEMDDGDEDGVYDVAFEDIAQNKRYRYYVDVIVDEVQYVLPSVVTRDVYSTMLAIGRYTDSYKIGQRFGHDNLHLWLGTPGHGTHESDEPVDYARRMYDFIAEAEEKIDEALLGPYVSGPFVVDDDYGIPALISRLATQLAGVLAYEARGIEDVDPNTNEPFHRLRYVRRDVMAMLRRINMGMISVTGSSSLTPTREPISGGYDIPTVDQVASGLASEGCGESCTEI